MRISTSQPRRGAIVPLAALGLIGLLGLVAMAMDMGILLTVRNQCQNAADSAAMAGARTLNGDTTNNNNYSNVAPNATTAVAANTIFNKAINGATQMTLTVGDYYYNTSTGAFAINPSALGNTGDNYTLVQATVTATQPTFFARVFGMTSLSSTATATAAHRPRDVSIVVDFSGSMRFESLLGYNYSGSRTLSMNADTVYPQFGYYATNSAQIIYSADQTASGGEVISAANVSAASTMSNTAIVNGFYGDATAFGTSTPAFTSASSAYATTPGGDVPLKTVKGSSSTYAYTVKDYLGGTTTRDWRFELDGCSAYAAGVANANTSSANDYANAQYYGYTLGPGYWGKTFYAWPPDPRIPLTTTYYTASQITNIVKQFLTDFGYTAADFANTSVLTETAITASGATTITVPTSPSSPLDSTATFPSSVPFKVMVGTVSSGAFTGTPEVMSVTAVSASANGVTKWTVTRAQDGTTALGATTTTPTATSITAAATSMVVNAITGFPTASLPFKIMVGVTNGTGFTGNPEIMNVTAVGGSGSKTWTVQRGQDGSTATAVGSSFNTYTVALVTTSSVGLLTGPPLYGTYTAASTTVSATVGKTPSTSSLWTGWTAATLGSYLDASVYKPAIGTTLATTDDIYHQTMRLLARNGGTGMPKNSAGTAMPCDWRSRFFNYASTGTPVMDNDTTMFSSGTLNVPSSSGYLINYNAILDWIKNSGTNPFPSQLRAGGIVYYSSIPSTIDNSHFPPTNPDQRFWKEYIDEVLGFQQTGGTASAPSYDDVSTYNGYGGDVSWGTTATSGQPSGWPTSTYMSYSDNPNRPLLRFWFGPITMVDYLGNYNASDADNYSNARLWWPGTVAECPTYQAKLGIQAALEDIFNNHPNDNVSLVFFSSPKTSASSYGYYNYTPSAMGRNERQMINSLWFSPKVISTDAEINLFNSTGANSGDIYSVPRANGGTCYTMALMLAYNQFSSASSLVSFTANAAAGTAGGNGRNGAAKLLVFETDGMVNTGASATLVSSTTGQGYYQVMLADINNLSASGTKWPGSVNGVTFSAGSTQAQGICTQMCNTLASGGFASTGKPVLIHCIAFGSLFDSTNNSSNKTNALQNLASMEVIGGVQTSGATTLPSYKIVVGNFNTRISNLQSAFSSIVQDGVQVSLISSGTNLP